MAFHTPHGSARFRLPWSWSASTTASCARRCGSRRDARFEIAKVERPRPARRSSHRPRRRSRAPLIVDAARLAARARAGPNVQPPEALISRGLEVHPHDARGTDLDVWIDRSLVRHGYAWSVPAAGERRVGVGSYEPRHHVKEPTREIARRLDTRRRPLPGQLVPARAAPGGRGRRLLRRRLRRALLPAVGRGHPHRLLLRDRLRRELRAVLAGDAAARAGARRLRGVLGGPRAVLPLRAAAAAPDPLAAAARADRAAGRDGPRACSAGARSRGTWSRPTRGLLRILAASADQAVSARTSAPLTHASRR